MRVLGLETSCDETAAAVVHADAKQFLHVESDVVASQVATHRQYGGVVPEIASRQHIAHILSVVDAALTQAKVDPRTLDGVICTQGPGLIGALLVGVQTAKALAYGWTVPFIGVNHLEGHLSAVYLDNDQPPPVPHLALLVSGGHSLLVRVRERGHYTVLGTTRDDAAGEAFDKVAKLLGLGYPGGVVIDRLAANGNPSAIDFPRALPGATLDFSFSGLKTAVRRYVEATGIDFSSVAEAPDDSSPFRQQLCDLAASFQEAVVDALVRKTVQAATSEGVRHVQLTGGVAANRRLRSQLAAALAKIDVTLHVPPPKRCTDNAAMIAAAGVPRLLAGERGTLALGALASLGLPA